MGGGTATAALIVVMLTSFFYGCFVGAHINGFEPTKSQIEYAFKVCEGHGGLEQITKYEIRCKDVVINWPSEGENTP